VRSWLVKAQVAGAAILLLTGVGLLLAPRLFRQPAAEPIPSKSRLLPDVGGRITRVVCSVNSARRAALRNADLVSNIVNSLPPRAKIVLLVNDREAFTVASNPWPDRVTFLELPSDKSFTIWPQDPFLVLRDKPTDQPGSQTHGRILVSRKFARADDRIMARAIAGEIDWPCEEATLDFEGGNLVADDRHVFIGGNTIHRNAVTKQLSEATIVQQFRQQLGLKVIVVGPVPQPIGHIDMMLTPLGNGQLALTDPGWGARLVEQQLAKAPQEVREFERQCEAMYFGDPRIQKLVDQQGKIVRPPEVVGGSARAIEHSREVAPLLDQLAEDLQAQGFEVHRVPSLFSPPRKPRGSDESREGKTHDDDADQNEVQVGYPSLTYNNVLLESVDRQPIVYLPQYGLPVLDDAARQQWRALGFEVHTVKGLAISAMYGGSLRCCVKVLTRE